MLWQLSLRLAQGVSRLDPERRKRHAKAVLARQRDDGGLAGRRGDSDCYYTGFALRALAILGQWDDSVIAAAAGFLAKRMQSDQPPVDVLSAVQSLELIERLGGRPGRIAATVDRHSPIERLIARLRRADGCFAKTEQSGPSSTYGTFLMVATAQLVGVAIPTANEIAAAIASRQQPDGGFAELPVVHRSGVNPTAAACSLLRMLDALPSSTVAAAQRYLRAVQSADAGWPAHGSAPCSDLLSTFAALTVLAHVAPANDFDLQRSIPFVESLELAEGGFRGAVWDAETDCEYAFYGLGCLGLLLDWNTPDR